MSSTDFDDDNHIDPDVDVYLSQITDCDLQQRFKHKTDDKEINNIINEVKPQNTIKQELWALKIWSSWASARNDFTESSTVSPSPIPVQLNNTMDFQAFEKWLPYFIMEVRNRDGNEYSPNSIKQIMANLFRYLQDNCDYQGISFLDKRSSFYKIIEARMKKMKIDGLGLHLKRADVVTSDDEEKLWATNVFNMDTSKGLFAATFFYTGKTLALRGRDEHRKLNIEQFQIKSDAQGLKYLKFWPILRKNHHDKILHDQMRKDVIIHYDNDNNNRSYVKILQKYLDHLPEKQGPFYRRPLDLKSKIAFAVTPVGVNTLAKMLKTLFLEANIDIETRNITNHGLRATAVTDLLKSGFETAVIKQRTGHRSDAIDSYFRSDTSSHKSTSVALDPPCDPTSHNQIKNANDSSAITVSTNNDNNNDCNDILIQQNKESNDLGCIVKKAETKAEDNQLLLDFRLGNKKIKIDISL